MKHMKPMKKMKRLLGVLLAAVMVLAMNITAFAADMYTITIKNSNSGHQYEAYQVFRGELSGNILSNVEWGAGVNDADLLSALKSDSTIGSSFNACNTAADVAEVLEDFTTNSEEIDAFAAVVGKHLSDSATGTSGAEPSDGKYSITGLSAGYYFVKDKNAVSENDASTKFILKLVKDTEVTPKSSVPKVEKKVQEGDYETNDGYGTGYNDVADWNIGDAVPFKLIGTLPSTYDDYDTYKYVFHDTLSAGLTYNGDVKVYYASNKEGTDKQDITSSFSITASGNGITVTCENLKNVTGVTKDSYIIVEYTAKLNINAEIGLDGNTNEVYLEFSNNPNAGGEGETGNTPTDKVIVFTYELDTIKVDGENNDTKLPGAEFKLKNSEGKWVTVDTAGKVTGWVEGEDNGSTLKSDEQGLFKVIGLDDGIYYLKETKAPDGYNELKNEIEIVITAATSNGQNWDGTPANALAKLDVTAAGKAGTGKTDTGIAGITVENNKGATLPETGGIGTTIFYVVGGILVIGAAVLLITRRRMNK